MTIHLPPGLPAAEQLRGEGLTVAAQVRAPAAACRIGLINLMPDKVATETQFARLLARAGRACELVLLRPETHHCRHAPAGHMSAFYRTWSEIDPGDLDGLIVTGAPVETLAFEAVDYWYELTGILDWAAVNGLPSMHVCWAGQAALYHYHGVGKHGLPHKQFGVYEQSVLVARHRLLQGIPNRFPVPVSRHTDVCAADLARTSGVTVLAASSQSGLCIVEDTRRRALCVFNHFEYDAGTLDREFQRDVAAGRPVSPPVNRALDGTGPASATPVWRCVAVQLFVNWMADIDASSRNARAVA